MSVRDGHRREHLGAHPQVPAYPPRVNPLAGKRDSFCLKADYRYALLPSLTASPMPHTLTATRSAPAGIRRAIFGPSQPPSR
jgi:hypothetical protein